MQSPHEKIYELQVPWPKKIEAVEAWPFFCLRPEQAGGVQSFLCFFLYRNIGPYPATRSGQHSRMRCSMMHAQTHVSHIWAGRKPALPNSCEMNKKRGLKITEFRRCLALSTNFLAH